MLHSHELLGFISPELGNRLLTDSAEDNKEVYEATIAGVATKRNMRPQFLKRQPKPKRHQLMLDCLQRPAFEEVAASLLRGWLLHHQSQLLIDFLDALKIMHRNGEVDDLPTDVTDEDLSQAIDGILAKHDRETVILYLHAFHSMNDAGWTNLENALTTDERLQFN